MYTDFAHVYDALMQGVDYAAWAEHYTALMLERGVPDGAQVLECACGTGNLTLPLSDRFRMTGMDISEEMLSIAADKATRAGKRLPFVRGDMAALKTHRPVDAVLATCDGVNYLLTPRRLNLFFAAAYAALKPGGALCFDVSTPYKLEHVLTRGSLGEDRGNLCYFWQNFWDAARRRVEMRLDIFVREGDLWRRIREEQVQRAWAQDELEGALTAAGFTGVRLSGGIAPEPRGAAQRWHISCVKP